MDQPTPILDSGHGELPPALLAAAPSRPWRLYCPGDLVHHMDGPVCSEGDRCAGVKVGHRSTEDHTFGRIRCDHCSTVQQALFDV